MTPDEIRELGKKGANLWPQDYGILITLAAELTAQLAQLNEGMEYVSSNGQLRVQVEAGHYPIMVQVQEQK